MCFRFGYQILRQKQDIKMKVLRIDEKSEFISIKFKIYCQQYGITIQYTT